MSARDRRPRALWTAALVVVLVACGRDVDLGGAMDDAGERRETSAPDRCGALVGPDVPSDCEACTKGSTDCQPNGCYGGYWCEAAARDCRKPPQTCL